jgi:hypothetical protein
MFSLHSQYRCTTAYVTSHTKSSDSSSGHIAVPSALRSSSQVNSESEPYVTTDGQSASLSWNKTPIWGLRPDFNYCLTVAVVLIWGVLSDKRTSLSFTLAAGPRQRNQSRVRVPWDWRPYITVSHLRLPFSSPPTTRSITVEVFDPASTRVELNSHSRILSYPLGTDHEKKTQPVIAAWQRPHRKNNNIMKF